SITRSQLVIICRCPVIAEYYRRGRELYVNNTVLSPVISCTLLCMALHSIAEPYKTVCLQWKAITQHTVKQHTAHS
ncbi:unnamed protein product, partial [Staurois parvus]